MAKRPASGRWRGALSQACNRVSSPTTPVDTAVAPVAPVGPSVHDATITPVRSGVHDAAVTPIGPSIDDPPVAPVGPSVVDGAIVRSRIIAIRRGVVAVVRVTAR